MGMLEHPVRILLDEERHARITAVARARGVSVATVVTEAIDRELVDPSDHRRAAGRRLIDAPNMVVPGPGELRDELETLRSRRA